MRTLARPIEVLTVTDEKGNMLPIRFKAKSKEIKTLITNCFCQTNCVPLC